METLYVSPNRLQPIYNKNKFNYKGPHCFGIRGYWSATQESLRSTVLDPEAVLQYFRPRATFWLLKLFGAKQVRRLCLRPMNAITIYCQFFNYYIADWAISRKHLWFQNLWMILTRCCNAESNLFIILSIIQDKPKVLSIARRQRKFNSLLYFPIKVEKQRHRYTELY